MLPTLKQGDFLILDLSINNFINDGIYLIESSAGTFIKRIHQNIDGNILITSDNIAYNQETYFKKEVSEIKILGKATLSWPEKII